MESTHRRSLRSSHHAMGRPAGHSARSTFMVICSHRNCLCFLSFLARNTKPVTMADPKQVNVYEPLLVRLILRLPRRPPSLISQGQYSRLLIGVDWSGVLIDFLVFQIRHKFSNITPLWAVSSAAEHRSYTPRVTSSNLVPPTTYSRSRYRLRGGCGFKRRQSIHFLAICSRHQMSIDIDSNLDA